MCMIEKKTTQVVMAQKVMKVERWHQFLKAHRGTFEGLPFELSHEWRERTSHAKIWRKKIPGKENHKYKGVSWSRSKSGGLTKEFIQAGSPWKRKRVVGVRWKEAVLTRTTLQRATRAKQPPQSLAHPLPSASDCESSGLMTNEVLNQDWAVAPRGNQGLFMEFSQVYTQLSIHKSLSIFCH